jgi:membrane protein
MTSTTHKEPEDRSLVARAKGLGSDALRYARLTFKAFGNDNTFELGAALAYYTIFSIVPLLVVVLAISGIIAGPDAAEGRLFGQISGLVGADTARALQSMLGDAYLSGRSLKATIIGVITLFIGATTVFNSLKNSMNKIWSIQPRPKSSLLAMLKTRVLAFSLVLGMGFLLVVSFGVSAVVVGFATRITDAMPGISGYVVTALTLFLNFAFTVGIFATLFKYLPDARVLWKDVIPGAIFTTLLFGVGKWLIAFYFNTADPASAFGAAEGLISLLLWTAYSSQIFFLGAEFTYVWAQEHGRPIQPDKGSVRVIQQEVMIDHGRVVSKTSKDDVLEQVREACAEEELDGRNAPAAKEGA